MAKKAAGARPKLADHERTKALKADFDAAHKAGIKALKERDFDRVGRVIERERQLIEQQRARLDKKKPQNRKGST